MKRFRICKLCGELHALNAWPDNHREMPPARSMLPSPNVVRDGLDDLFHPMNNQRYDSKREFSRVTSQLGGIEVGNEVQKDTRYLDTASEADVAEAYHKVEQGYVPHLESANADDMASII